MNKKTYLYIFVLIFLYCESPIEPDVVPDTTAAEDCTLEHGGIFDQCGVCAGGTSGNVINDCADMCGRFPGDDGYLEPGVIPENYDFMVYMKFFSMGYLLSL